MSEFATSLRLSPIDSAAARAYLERHHDLGAGHPFALALGIFWRDVFEGVMTWGNPRTNNAVQAYGLHQRDAWELRKFWLSDVPPPMSEGRCLGVAVKLLRKRYPSLRLLLTYCGGDEDASAYKGAGWIAQEAYTYISEVRIGARWISLREFNRRGGLSRVPHDETRTVYRRKWVYPLDEEMRQKLARLAKQARE
ncbi:MAG: hypothetical protein M3Y58_22800 [Chloroflexota bacterium]|nr:hypothetical protein [Chloroflexota bacterium]